MIPMKNTVNTNLIRTMFCIVMAHLVLTVTVHSFSTVLDEKWGVGLFFVGDAGSSDHYRLSGLRGVSTPGGGVAGADCEVGEGFQHFVQAAFIGSCKAEKSDEAGGHPSFFGTSGGWLSPCFAGRDFLATDGTPIKHG